MDDSLLPPPAGTRFTVNLEDGSEDDEATVETFSNGLISDVSERTAVSSPALAPTLDAAKSSSGFPAHTKRKRPSAFRQKRQAAAAVAAAATTAAANNAGSIPPNRQSSGPAVKDEMASIRAENAQRLADMSTTEVEKEREELMGSLSPELLQMFLKRASLDDVMETSRPVKLEEPPSIAARPPHLQDIPESAFPPSVQVHFPQPESQSDPDLDPSSPEFLTQLHEKYFPSLPADPQKLAWMMPPTDTEPDPHYSPMLNSILPSSVRFDFRGRLLPPRKSREIPAHLGLHHHGDSPLSAGYTIPELAHLARSSFPAQRCMAYQTLGRILYRLGSGSYSKIAGGDEIDTRGKTDLDRGLWRCLHEGRVIDGLQEAATGGKNGEGSSHLGVKNYALEALWLWQKGGGERWKAD